MGKRRKEKAIYVDDGRVIASMNVEGMPWYTPKSVKTTSAEGSTEPLTLSRRETLAFMFGVLKAVLLVGAVFIGGLLAFILFCTEIWFR